MQLLRHSDARVGSVSAVRVDATVRNAIDSPVERNRVVLINKLAGVDALPEADKDVLLALDVVLSETCLESFSGLPSVVVRDLARDVVGNVGLSDTVEEVRANGSEPVAVNGAERATRESPGLGLVVRKGRVGVLEVSDHDEPVVAPEVGDDVVTEDVRKATLGEHAPGGESAESSSDTNVRDDDLVAVTLVKDDGIGVEVVGELGVVELTRSVAEEVQRPAEELLNEDVGQVVEGSILENLGKPLAPGLLNLRGTDLLLDGVFIVGVVSRFGSGLKGETATLLTGTGNEDLVTGQVTGGGVVAGVRDSPRVVRNEKGRVKNPADGVVEGLAGAEALVTALVSNDPDTGEDHTLENPVGGPGGETSKSLLSAERNIRRESVGLEAGEGAGDSGVNVASGQAKSSNHGKVAKHVGERFESRSLKAVSGDGREKVLDGVVGNIEGRDILLVVGLCLAVRVTNIFGLAGLATGRSGGGLLAGALTCSGDVGGHCGRHVCQ